MRKKREDRESLKSVGERIKSEEDMEEIMDGIKEKEMEDKKMSQYEVIKKIMMDDRKRKVN